MLLLPRKARVGMAVWGGGIVMMKNEVPLCSNPSSRQADDLPFLRASPPHSLPKSGKQLAIIFSCDSLSWCQELQEDHSLEVKEQCYH